MGFNKKHAMILLIFICALLVMRVALAKDVDAAKTKKVTVRIHDFKPGVLWAPKAVKLKNGDAIAGYVTYSGNMQFDRGTGVTAWYIGNGMNGDIEPHHTKIVKVKFYFKNVKKHVKTKTVKGNSAHISTGLIKGYAPYKAKVWYRTY